MMMVRSSRRYGVAVVLGAFLLTSGPASAAEVCDPLSGRLASLEGTVELQRGGAGPWNAASLSDRLCKNDTIRTGRNSRAAIALANDAVMRLDQQTTLKLLSVTPKEEERSLLNLILGAVQSFSRKPRKFAVNTPYLNATIEGTEFVLRAEAGRSEVTVFEGTVVAQNNQGKVSVTGGEAAAAQQGQAPVKRIAVRPRDAVQWALYYPPVLAAGQGQGAVRRAADLLNAGRVAEARTEIDRAIAGNQNAGAAYALRAVINVAQNRKDQALADAEQAVKLSPRSAAARIALSYAQQAHFQLEAARDTLRQAVTDQPNDALAWARLSELWLMLGERGEARRAAQKAAAIAPNLARAQTVLGFAALTEFRSVTASAAFNKAIAAAPSDPLPRLGLGLAKIRQGDMDEGRKDLEIAVGLDSQNALLRAYLGKAYFEETRDPLDAQQLEIAKKLDPNDPTAYLYDAIRKQTENNPGGALKDLQDSIARNDNRAVYRGRLQLDQDRAARGTSLARVYNDLGFSGLGTNEAMKSLALDPSNAAAHRFLSDSYQGVRRRETARVSELLQAQLMQDVNINPLQPSSGAANLNVGRGAGAAQAGFNEFTRLFESNGVQLSASGGYGNQGTYSHEAVLSAVYDRFSVSAGEFGYATDGFRDNNEIDHRIYNFFVQAAVTPDLNVQFEARRRSSEEGDLDFNFDPDSFDSTFGRDIDQDIIRGGVRYSVAPGHDLLFSAIRSIHDETFSQSQDFFGSDLVTAGGGTVTTNQYEAQYILRAEWLNLVSGYGYVDGGGTGVITSSLPDGAAVPFPPFVFPPGAVLQTVIDREENKHSWYYSYLNVSLPKAITLSFGVTYDDVDKGVVKFTKWSPKFGAQWNVTDGLRLRLAALQTVKPTVITNRTIQPTQIAGFTQLYDDAHGTISKNYSFGIDGRLTDSLFAGIEGVLRRRTEPIEDTGAGVQIDTESEEHSLRGYINWKPGPFSISLAVFRDRYMTDDPIRQNLPRDLQTWGVPVAVRYFHPWGVFASIGATYIDQEVERLPASSLASGSSDFVTADAAIGYRLPNRIGVVSLQVANLFDRRFEYQDDSFRDLGSEPSTGPYFPERTFLARASLRF